jgi:hypothetical protein
MLKVDGCLVGVDELSGESRRNWRRGNNFWKSEVRAQIWYAHEPVRYGDPAITANAYRCCLGAERTALVRRLFINSWTEKVVEIRLERRTADARRKPAGVGKRKLVSRWKGRSKVFKARGRRVGQL